jgi:ubiquinone/menaquinone biosynthesis C-methylase UbiE
VDVRENQAVEERLAALLRELDIRRVHVAGGFTPNAVDLARSSPETVASVALICPMMMPLEPFMPAGVPLLVVHGDDATLPTVIGTFPGATGLHLHDYEGVPWSDVMAERGDEISPTLLQFLSMAEQRRPVEPAHLAEGSGEIAGVTYRIQGSGPAVLLLPLSLARSQWGPYVDVLAQHYTTIVVDGPHLGVVPTLESRMQGGYRRVVRSVVDAAHPTDGERVLEVGCGPGAVARWLARHLSPGTEIAAVDVNGYLLREAAALTEAAGLGHRITFKEGDAVALPFGSDSFDVTLSFTVMEEVDADRMLAEMLRVTRPGGRLGVVVRAIDQPRFLNVSLPAALDAKVLAMSAPRMGVSRRGCADVSLYRRFVDAGLSELEMGPQLALERGERLARTLPEYADRIAHGLSTEESRQFRDAIAQAEQDRTLLYALPYHCAVGVKA